MKYRRKIKTWLNKSDPVEPPVVMQLDEQEKGMLVAAVNAFFHLMESAADEDFIDNEKALAARRLWIKVEKATGFDET